MVHEPGAACEGWHCYSCNEDEYGSGYVLCLECGHIWRTARDLRRAYRRQYWRASKPLTLMGAVEFPGIPWWFRAWHVVTVRADKITFCQLCIHDF